MPQHHHPMHSGASRRIQQIQRENDSSWTDIYDYSTGPVGTGGFNLTSGSIQNQNIQLEADSHFNLMRITGYAEPAGSTFPLADGLQYQLAIMLQDGSTSRNLFNNPLPWGTIIGTARLPYVLPQYRMFQPNGVINLLFYNFSSVTYDNICVVLHGVKVYNFKGNRS
jgi:hypothetical protein